MRIRSLSLFVLPLFVTGCTSLSFSGPKGWDAQAADIHVPHKLRLAACAYKASQRFEGQQRDDDMLSIPGTSGRTLNRAQLSGLLVSRYPAVFTHDKSGIPLVVAVDYCESKRVVGNDLGGALLSLLGVIPIRASDLEDRCRVCVCFDGDENRLATESVNVDFKSVEWLTILSPFGAMMSDDVGEGGNVSRKWHGLFMPFDMGKIEKEVYDEVLAGAVMSCVAKLKEEDIQRRALLLQVTGGQAR